jgi:hypothetical protein
MDTTILDENRSFSKQPIFKRKGDDVLSIEWFCQTVEHETQVSNSLLKVRKHALLKQ